MRGPTIAAGPGRRQHRAKPTLERAVTGAPRAPPLRRGAALTFSESAGLGPGVQNEHAMVSCGGGDQ
eukprot:11159683-Lingulodinium_polyedra.AAC.1